jgi:hypothetical protein
MRFVACHVLAVHERRLLQEKVRVRPRAGVWLIPGAQTRLITRLQAVCRGSRTRRVQLSELRVRRGVGGCGPRARLTAVAG